MGTRNSTTSTSRTLSPNTSGTIQAQKKSLTDLPQELIFSIFSFIDSKSLLRLTQTCHLLTALSLDVFFRRHRIKTTYTSGSDRHTAESIIIDITTQRSNRLILSALCIASVTGACPALFRSGRSININWRAAGDHNSSCLSAKEASTDVLTNSVVQSDGWIKEVKHLKRLLSLNRHAQDGSLGFASVTMDFSRAVSFGGTRAQARMVNSRVILPWLRDIGGLLDVASRSTRCLRIVGGEKVGSKTPEIDLRSKGDGEEKESWAWEMGSTAMLGTWEKGWRGERYSKGLHSVDAAATERCWAVTSPGASQSTPTLVRRLEVCDPSFLQNPTVYRWLMRWANSSLA